MLKCLEINQDNKITHFHAWVGTYAENVYTSHILEYELYVLFRKYKKQTIIGAWLDSISDFVFLYC